MPMNQNIFCMLALLFTSFSLQTIVGGFSPEKDLKLCKEYLKKAGPQLLGFDLYKVITCEKQIVNGLNYRMKLQKKNRTPSKCIVTVHIPFDGSTVTPLKGNNGDSDCFFEGKIVDWDL